MILILDFDSSAFSRCLGSTCRGGARPSRCQLLTLGSLGCAWLPAGVSALYLWFCLGLVPVLESGWHRHLRRRRTVARKTLSVLHRAQALTGRRLRLLERLVKHHSWNFWTAPLSIRHLVVKMSKWDCQYCNIKNSMSALHCVQCQTHWSRAWVAPQSASKSRSKSRKARRKDSKEKKDPKESAVPETPVLG